MEDEWKKYLNQVELEEVEAIKLHFSNLDRYLSNNESNETQFNRDRTNIAND